MEKLRFIMQYAKPQQKRLLTIFLYVLLYAGFMLIAPLIISFMVDSAINGLPIQYAWLETAVRSIGGTAYLRENLWIGAVIIFIVYVVIAFALYKRGVDCGIIGETFAKNIRDAMYDHLQKLPFSYHKSRDSGDLIQRSTSDIEQVRRFLGTQISEMMYAILIVLVAACILYSIHPKLMLLSVMVMPFLVLASLLFFTKAKRIFLSCDWAESEMTTVLQENLNATRVVKAFNRELFEIDKFEKANEKFRQKLCELLNALALFWGSTDFLCTGQILVMIYFGIQFAQQGTLSAGNFFVFLTYEGMIIWPMRQLGRIIADMGKVSVAITRIKEVLDEPSEDLTTGLTPEVKGHIEFKHVSFQYEDGDAHTLHDINFSIEPKQTVAIMGPTGSGKSSLVHLLTRIYDYNEGSILIDGVELRTISKAWIRKQISIVLQEPFLFSKSIYDNIALAKRGASASDVKRAAKLASIHDVIETFDQGYDTEVGERGVTLSGGQKQRIAIARTIINESPIVIFDDSLSALDTKTDANIQEALKTISADMTMLIITHRVNSARGADKIIVLDEGRIAQIGTHEELIHQEGLYKKIHDIQNEGRDEA